MKYLFLLLIPSISFAYDVNIFDLDNGQSVVEVIDSCEVKHHLIIKTKEISSGKVLEWFENLSKTNDLDACLKNKQQTIDSV